MENRNKELHSIFKGIANKDENEFNNLYKKYKSLIYSVVFSMLKNKEDSEEVVQIIFTKIWSIKAKNLPTKNETAWLYNVAKNETINYLRKQKNTLDIDDLYYIDEENKELNNIINIDYYNKILSKLNTKDKEIVSLKILSSLSFKEISQILNIPIGTVQWKYYKSLHTLKMLMSNLTMFILTFTLYIKQRNTIEKQIERSEENIKKDQLNSVNKEEQKITNEIERGPIDSYSDETKSSNTNLNSNATNIAENEQNLIQKDENTTNREETIDNNTAENSTEVKDISNETVENTIVEKTDIKPQNNTLFYISSIFLIMTIIFSAIWIKQKLHKTTK